MRKTSLRVATAAIFLALAEPAHGSCCRYPRHLVPPRAGHRRRADRLRLRRRPLDRPADGSDVRRLTATPGPSPTRTSRPTAAGSPSPAQYDGNVDVYVVPLEGGEPTRLTWHPGDDVVRGFTPDGRRSSSPRSATVFTNRFTQFFTVGTEGGFPTRAAGPERRSRGDLARRQVPRLHPAGRAVPPVEELPGRHRLADLDLQARRPLASSRSPSPRAAATTPTRCGSATPSISCPTATASSTCTPTTATSKQVEPADRARRLPDRGRLGRRGRIVYEQAGTCTSSTRGRSRPSG